MRRWLGIGAAAAVIAASVVLAPQASAERSAQPAQQAVGVISPSSLASLVEQINEAALVKHAVFSTDSGTLAREVSAFIPRSMPPVTRAEALDFAASEALAAAATANRLAAQGEIVTVTSASVADTSDSDGVQVVTLHVARTLKNGIVWEEMTPYAVGLGGGLLPAGRIVKADLDALDDGALPSTIQAMPGIPQLGHETVDGPIDHGPPSSPDLNPAHGPIMQPMDIGSTGRTKAANYALKWALSYNPAYIQYSDNDCTNFVSQAMEAGGWPYEWGFYTSDSNWWYGGVLPKASYTWGGAENFYRFARNEPQRVTRAPYVVDLRVGDILQYKNAGATNMTHSMMVTAKIGSSICLSYHTNPTKNRPYSEMANKNVTWFAHYVK